MKKSILLILCGLLFAMWSTAQNKDKNVKKQERELWGYVLDNVTHHHVSGALVELLRSDSSVVKFTKPGGVVYNGNVATNLEEWSFDVSGSGIYLLRFSHDGYKTQYVRYKAVFGRREYHLKVPTVYLQKGEKVHQLGEVVVTATKVKFYNKGDTIVYNADAFQLSEGSMLDALIRQLPGAELKSDGRIYINGRFIESLLLNGKDFFKGNNQIMLDNLPTYMVKDIKVYDKANETSEFLKQNLGNKRLVMDVSLKKKYSVNWVANAEAGAGSNNRYLGRLFAMRFTDHSHLSIYGNINNLNDTRKPGENGSWKPSDLTGGLLATKMAGIDYSVDARSGKYKISGNTQIKYSDNDNISNTNRVNFLSDGNTYDRIRSVSRNYDTQISTKHEFTFNFDRFNLTLDPEFNYHKYDNHNNYLSATFSDDLSLFGKEQLDSIYTPDLGSTLRKIAINRNLQTGKTNGNKWNASLSAESVIKLSHTSDHLEFEAAGNYKNTDEDSYNHYRVDYFTNGNSNTDFRNQYYKNRPEHGYDYSAKALYCYFVNNGLTISPYYQYRQEYGTRDRSLYRLDKLDGWNSDADYALGMLPSAEVMKSVLDANNSYDAHNYNHTNILGTMLWLNKYSSNYFYWAQADLSLNFLHRKMLYRRASVDTALVRRSTLLNLSNTFFEIDSKDKKRTLFFSYYIETSTPDMTYMVDVRDDSNPLQVTVGNSGLKNTYMHKWYLYLGKKNTEKQSWFSFTSKYNLTTNALCMGYMYDKATGVRTIKPDNVNGNWDARVRVAYETPFDKKKHLVFNTSTSVTHYHNVDLVGVEGADESQRSTVNTMYLQEKLNLNYKLTNFQIGLIGSGTWTHATGNKSDFSTINAGDFNYGATALLKLPHSFQIGTDLTMYSRRGYDDRSMNTNDLVWNARLSKSILHGKLFFMFDGFDLLGNLSNVTRSLNAQARTEVFTNVIPRYAMFHVVYHLNIAPKKKK